MDAWIANQVFLVVEDIATSRLLVAGILRSLGAPRVMSAASGEEALEKLEKLSRAEELPSVVFCDWLMPGMDGIAVLSEIKRLYPATKVVMLTSKTEAKDVAEAVAKGADGFIGKPFSRKTLLDALPRLMKAA